MNAQPQTTRSDARRPGAKAPHRIAGGLGLRLTGGRRTLRGDPAAVVMPHAIGGAGHGRAAPRDSRRPAAA